VVRDESEYQFLKQIDPRASEMPRNINVKAMKKRGRPEMLGYSDEDLIDLGEEMIRYLADHDESVVHLSHWYSVVKGISKSDWKAICKRIEFLPYYERAIEWVGCNILQNRELPTAYGSRFLSIYFQDLREHEREVKREEIQFTAELKAKMDATRATPPNDAILSLNLELIKKIGEQQKKIKELESMLSSLESA